MEHNKSVPPISEYNYFPILGDETTLEINKRDRININYLGSNSLTLFQLYDVNKVITSIHNPYDNE